MVEGRELVARRGGEGSRGLGQENEERMSELTKEGRRGRRRSGIEALAGEVL